MLCMDKLFLQAIAGKNFLRIPIDITYYYGVSVWIRIPINTMSRGHNPIRSDERSTANMASTDTERDLPWPWMGCCILTVNHARGERSLATSWEEELVFLQYWQALFQKTRMFLKLTRDQKITFANRKENEIVLVLEWLYAEKQHIFRTSLLTKLCICS